MSQALFGKLADEYRAFDERRTEENWQACVTKTRELNASHEIQGDEYSRIITALHAMRDDMRLCLSGKRTTA